MLQQPESFEPLIRTAFYEAQPTQDEYAPTIATSVLAAFFAGIMRAFGDTVILIDGADYLVEANADFSAMLRYTQHHFRTVTLSEMADVFHFSEAYVSRLFKRHLNQNFTTVLQNMKVEKTRRYLERSSLSLAEISEQVGYSSAEHLSRIFRRKYGVVPSVYRKKFQKGREEELSSVKTGRV